MKFKVFRDWLQQMIYKIINPIVHGMIKIGITPNFITTTGLILNIVAACIFLYAGMKGERGDFYYIGWGGGIILFARNWENRAALVQLCADIKARE